MRDIFIPKDKEKLEEKAKDLLKEKPKLEEKVDEYYLGICKVVKVMAEDAPIPLYFFAVSTLAAYEKAKLMTYRPESSEIVDINEVKYSKYFKQGLAWAQFHSETGEAANDAFWINSYDDDLK